MSRPEPVEFAPFYAGYINQVPEENLLSVMAESVTEIEKMLERITDSNINHRYAVGKWSIKELLQHLVDTERIFAYRALCFARGEQQPLPGFDENQYTRKANGETRTLVDLKDELLLLRRSTILLFSAFGEDILLSEGTASGAIVTVKALGYMMIGHVRHHRKILEERYLQ